MARALWTGFINFGLVSVPIGLFRATEDQTIAFHQIHKGTSHRIRYKKVDEITGEEVGAEDIVSGYDTGDGEYVVLTKDERRDAAAEKSDSIEIVDFVDLASIDPVQFRSSYYVAPRGKGADRAYALLRQAMQETHKVGIATLVMRDKEHLVAIRPGEEALILETMYFPAEVRSAREELDTLPATVAFTGRELEIAKTLIESMTVDWDPSEYHDTYRERVLELIEAKSKGTVPVVRAPAAPSSNVVDLMSALEASVAQGKATASPDRANGSARAKRAKAPAAAKPTTEMTKAELLKLAGEFDIYRRSSMSKQELADAVDEAVDEAEAATTRRPGKRKARASA
ncbi:MAG TPA: Ku protein [Mycobacteriales bacterium]|nr:Ku protein [Mycobacteriales bacterium]